MKKLALSLEELSVESFDTTPRSGRGGGTVQAHDNSDSTCYDIDCVCTGGLTCVGSCNGTCDNTCRCEPQTVDLTICNRPISLCGACTYGGGTCDQPTNLC